MATRKQVHSDCTINDWKRGVHEAWEVAAHVEALRFYQSRGTYWTLEQRRNYIDQWLQKTCPEQWNKPTPCEVCQEIIAESVLRGKKPFEITEEMRTYLKSIKAFVMSKRMTPMKRREMMDPVVPIQVRD